MLLKPINIQKVTKKVDANESKFGVHNSEKGRVLSCLFLVGVGETLKEMLLNVYATELSLSLTLCNLCVAIEVGGSSSSSFQFELLSCCTRIYQI